MPLFDNMLKDSESLFLNPEVLDFDYQPKLVPFRENHQNFIASCIKPLFQKRNGRNIFAFGQPGIGKTVSCRHVLKELEEKTEEIIPIYINVWKSNTAHKITLEICNHINYKFTADRSTDELIKAITPAINKKSLVLCLDEIDKLKKEEHHILYHLLEDIYRKTIILITNNKDWLTAVDNRIKSRLLPEDLEFKPYTEKETYEILKQRIGYAFVQDLFQENILKQIAKKTFELQDMRTGLYLLKESAEIAESRSSKEITQEHINQAMQKLKDYKRIPANNLDPDISSLLSIIKQNTGKSTKDIHDIYNQTQKIVSYKTLRRKLEKLKQANLIDIKEEFLGVSGKTSTVHYNTAKTLNDF
ncbi:MAG: AAA family ATPase [Nanoarchaeota archaeon]|nr:AAA family ATPase [Nanoarchaeota archaeon]